jgi:RNA polymerase sigma factor (sigma-70 family)
MEVPDVAVVQRAQRKDAQAFALLIGSYERVALSVAFGVLGDAAAAGDVAQEAFIRAWERLGDLREPQRFGTWLCGIVRNLAIDCVRRKKPTEPLTAVAAQADVSRWSTDPSDRLSQRESEEQLAQAMGTLDELTRQIVAMRYYDDLSSKQIAELLEMTPASVDMRLSRARKQLKTVLERQVGPQPAGSRAKAVV